MGDAPSFRFTAGKPLGAASLPKFLKIAKSLGRNFRKGFESTPGGEHLKVVILPNG